MSYKLLGDKEVYTVNETYNKEEVNEIQESLEQHLDTAVEEYLDESHTVETRVDDYMHSEEVSEAIKEEVGNNYYDKQAADERFANLNSPHLAGHPTTPNASKLPVDTGVWKIGDEFVDVAMHPTTEPIGEVQSVTLLGSIVDYGSHYYIKVEDAWYEVTGLATDRILYDSDPVTDEAVIAVLEASDTIPVNHDMYHAEVDDNQQIANLKYVDDALQSAKDYADSKDATTLQSAKDYADSADATTLQSAKDYADSADATTLQSAKDYADSADATTLQSAKDYADSKDAETLQSAKDYADSEDATTLQSAKDYADSEGADTLQSAKDYADSADATTLQSAKDYADSEDATTLQAAKNYTDQHVPEMTAANVDYANTDSGLSATNVQSAIDELAQGGGGGGVSDYADLTNKPSINGKVLVANEDGHTYKLVNMSDLPFEETPERISITTQRGITSMPLYQTGNASNFKFAVYHDAIYLVNTEGPNANYLFKSTDGLNYSPVTAYTEYAKDIFVWQDKLWICSVDDNNSHGPICWTTDAVTFNWECGKAVTEHNDNAVNAYCFSDDKLYIALYNDGFGGYGVWETTGNGTWTNTSGYTPDSGDIQCMWHTSTGIVVLDMAKSEQPFSRNGTALQMQESLVYTTVTAGGVFQDYAYLVTYDDGSGDSYLYLIGPNTGTVIRENIGVITSENPIFVFKDNLYKINYDNTGNDYSTIYYKDTPTSEWQSLTLYDTSTVDQQIVPQFCVYRENGEDVALYAALANGQNTPNMLVYSFDGETFDTITATGTINWLAGYYNEYYVARPLSQPTVSFNGNVIAITVDPNDSSNGLPLVIEGPLPAGNSELQYDAAPTEDSDALMKSGDIYDSITKIEATDTFTQNTSFPNSYRVNTLIEYNGKLYVGTDGSHGIYVSSDGETFTQNTSFPSNVIYTLAEYGGKLYVGTDGSHGIYVSSDGTTFTQNTSFPTTYSTSTLAEYNGKLYVGTQSHGLYVSSDGETFTQNTSIDTDYSINTLYVYNGKLYAGASTNGLYVSSDGETFNRVSGYTAGNIQTLIEYNGKLYVGTSSHGLYESSDGETFTQNTSFPTSYTALAFAEYNGKLYVGTSSHGLYVSSDSETFTQNTSLPTNIDIRALYKYNGKLYVGTSTNGIYINNVELSPFVKSLLTLLRR